MRTTIQATIVMIYLSIIVMIMMVSGTFNVYNIEERDYSAMQRGLEQLAQEIEIRLNWQSGNTINSEDIRDKMKSIINENSFYILGHNNDSLFALIGIKEFSLEKISDSHFVVNLSY